MIRAHEFMLKFRLKILFFVMNVLTFVRATADEDIISYAEPA